MSKILRPLFFRCSCTFLFMLLGFGVMFVFLCVINYFKQFFCMLIRRNICISIRIQQDGTLLVHGWFLFRLFGQRGRLSLMWNSKAGLRNLNLLLTWIEFLLSRFKLLKLKLFIGVFVWHGEIFTLWNLNYLVSASINTWVYISIWCILNIWDNCSVALA